MIISPRVRRLKRRASDSRNLSAEIGVLVSAVSKCDSRAAVASGERGRPLSMPDICTASAALLLLQVFKIRVNCVEVSPCRGDDDLCSLPKPSNLPMPFLPRSGDPPELPRFRRRYGPRLGIGVESRIGSYQRHYP